MYMKKLLNTPSDHLVIVVANVKQTRQTGMCEEVSIHSPKTLFIIAKCFHSKGLYVYKYPNTS